MSDLPPNPTDMLRMYRLHAPAFDDEQAALFRKMSFKDQLELLFRMVLQANAVTHHIHSKIDPNVAPVQGMPEPPKVN